MKLLEIEILNRIKYLKGWFYENGKLNASFKFENFKQTFTIMTRIAFEAETLQHHPEWSNSYNQLDIHLTTHDESGVTEKDFELAEIINKIIS